MHVSAHLVSSPVSNKHSFSHILLLFLLVCCSLLGGNTATIDAISSEQMFYQSHVLVDTWMLTVKLVYKLNVSDDLKCTTNTQVTPFTPRLRHKLTICMTLDAFCSFFFTQPPPVHPCFYLSLTGFTRPNDGWMGVCIKLCISYSMSHDWHTASRSLRVSSGHTCHW